MLYRFPLRMLRVDWLAAVSGKWLSRILLRDRVHDGEKIQGQPYRVPCKPVPPGTIVVDEDMYIIQSMPMKFLTTFPKSGITQCCTINSQERMYPSIDFGGRRQHWSANIEFPEEGYYEIWTRADDDRGYSRPQVLPAWNPRGYLNNACHRIAVKVTG